MLNLRGAVVLDNPNSSQVHERVAQILKDYNPDLELQYIPEGQRTSFEKPFRVVHRPVGQPEYVIGYFETNQVNHNLIAHIFKHDTRNRNVLNDLEAEEKAKEALMMREALDKAEERMEVTRSIIRSPKSTYKYNGKVYR